VHQDWIFDDDDHRFMGLALDEARAAAGRGEVPVGCVVTRHGEVISRNGNRRQHAHDPAGHAEVVALRAAGEVTGDWRLEGCTLYVTLEPCAMCVSACRQARIDLVVWGAADPVLGACGSAIELAEDPRLGRPLAHRGGLRSHESRDLLQSFFTKARVSS
jgi:tRNA(adenine34) deaminase